MPDRHIEHPASLILGTAGHIDHGKTSLVQALTGIDTDRLAEEKRRGISIDLGFAHMTLPSRDRVSFIDVPGHERFVKNMLAGVGGIDAVLLVVAADEGVKPQTREHFEICRLLGITRGVIAMTKADLVTEEQLQRNIGSVDELRRGSFLEDAPVIAVSSRTGHGLDPLRKALETLASTARPAQRSDLVRMPIDRSFVSKGFGTVVTGTLWGGSLQVGDTVQIHPLGRTARVRGLQLHGAKQTAAGAGQRTAVNLSGIDHTEIERGFTLTSPDVLESSKTVHAVVRWLSESATPSRREEVLFYAGTSEVPCRVRVLQLEYRDEQALVQLDLAGPALVLPGDRYVLRRPSPAETIGGGTVIDAFPPKKLSRTKASARAAKLLEGNLAARVEVFASERENGRTLGELRRLTGKTTAQIQGTVSTARELVFDQVTTRILTRSWLNRKRALLLEWLKDFHAKNPSLSGAPISAARLRLEPALATFVLRDFPAVQQRGDVIALADHKVQVNREDTAALRRIETTFRAAGYQPAHPREILREVTSNLEAGARLLEQLVKEGRLVRISEGLVFHADVIAHIRNSLAQHKGRRFSVPEFKEWTQVSRKYAIPLLEYLDHHHITQRQGDARVVL